MGVVLCKFSSLQTGKVRKIFMNRCLFRGGCFWKALCEGVCVCARVFVCMCVRVWLCVCVDNMSLNWLGRAANVHRLLYLDKPVPLISALWHWQGKSTSAHRLLPLPRTKCSANLNKERLQVLWDQFRFCVQLLLTLSKLCCTSHTVFCCIALVWNSVCSLLWPPLLLKSGCNRCLLFTFFCYPNRLEREKTKKDRKNLFWARNKSINKEVKIPSEDDWIYFECS